ncbi:MAG: peptidoglycan D,D-transpeptidase FtsI family protein [Candidatus Spyradocola sp.]|jgi:peptidoglycan glycosyltransferase
MKQMKKNVRAVLCTMLALFTALSGYFFYAVYANGSRWFTTPYNTRLRQARGTVLAGDILDRNGTVLVTSAADGSREYPTDRETRKALSHVLGDVDGNVPTGAETFLAADLLGFRASLVDRASQLFAEKRRGSDVQLTIDADLQTYIAEQFPDEYNGAVALLNYETGEVLALYSKPEYDAKHPEDYEDVEDETGVLLNRATQGRYAPGSVFKIVTLACALENIPGVENRTFTCTGTVPVTEEMNLTDTDGEGHGTLTLKEAFAKSCNIAFGELALELGEEKLRSTAERMGFNGNFLFEDLIVYESLFPKSIADDGELAWTGVGQGNLMAVPMHMAMIAGAVGNGGTMVEPQLVLSVRGAAGGVTNRLNTHTALVCMNASIAATIEEYMIETVENGTATRAAVEGHVIAGKTGTAQVNSSGGRYSPHAWYVGYCAEEETPYAIAVVVENGGSGGSAAARLAGKVMSKAIESVQPAQN